MHGFFSPFLPLPCKAGLGSGSFGNRALQKPREFLVDTYMSDTNKTAHKSGLIEHKNFYNKKTKDKITSEEVENYLQSLSKDREDRQIRQASETIQLYLLYKERKNTAHKIENMPISAQWKIIADAMQKVLRLMYRLYRTDQAYTGRTILQGSNFHLYLNANRQMREKNGYGSGYFPLINYP